MSEWIEKKCVYCGEKLFVKANWLNSPKACTRCRAKNVEDKIKLLQHYFRSRKKMKARPMTQEDRKLFNHDKSIRSKIFAILNKYDNKKDKINKLTEDIEICKFILKTDKQRCIQKMQDQRYKTQRG